MNALLKPLSLVVGLVAVGGLLAAGITEETPVGAFAGTLTMAESGKPLPDALIILEPQAQDDEGRFRRRFAETDEKGRFRLPNLMGGTYVVTTTTKAHRVKPTAVQITAGKPVVKDFKAESIDPYLDLYATQRVFTPAEKPRVDLTGFFKKDTATEISLYKLDFEKAASEGSLYSAFAYLNRLDGKFTDPSRFSGTPKKWSRKLESRDAEGVFTEKVELDPLPEGLYWLVVKGEKMVRGAWLMSTQLAMVAKTDGSLGVALTTDITTGKPLAGVSVGRMDGPTFVELGKSDIEGKVRFAMAQPKAVLVAKNGASRALIDFSYGARDTQNLRVATYTDRPIYRPGDTVRFKGIVRKVMGANLAPSTATTAKVTLRDDDGEPLEEKTLPIAGFGTYNGEFETNKELASGYYTLATEVGGAEFTYGFSIASYRKPTYKITATSDKPTYTAGESAKLEVKTEYYFGGPVPDAKVTAYVYRTESWGYDWDQSGGEYVAEVEGKTDEKGICRLTLPTKLAEDGISESNYDFNVQISVSDAAGKYFDASHNFDVKRGEIDLSATTDLAFGNPQRPVQTTFEAKAADGSPLANVPIAVQWGEYRWDNKDYVLVEPRKETLTTDSMGKATVTVTPTRGGQWRVEGDTQDAKGNKIRASAEIWVTGEYSALENDLFPSLSATVDKPNYKVGETAQVLIRTKKPGGSALVAVEGEKLYEVRVVPLNEAVTTLELPILDEYTPNVRVSVSYVIEKQFLSANDEIRIDRGWRKLQVKVEPQQPTVRPGETASYKITTLDADGKAVPAEVSLGIVDESIYALAEDSYDLVDTLYPNRYGVVETNHSFPDLYLDGGDKAPTNIVVRRKFEDTAFWAPSVTTDAAGQATISAQLPDNLTTWRATVRGISAKSEVGQATSTLLANKPLMVRLETPEFLTTGDSQVVKAVITNQTGEARAVKLQLQAEGVDLEGTTNPTVQVPANGTEAAEIRLNAKVAGTAKIVAKAWIEGSPENDGVERALPVKPFGRDFVDQSAGDVKGTGQVTLTLRDGADLNYGRLRLTVGSGLASAALGPLDSLIGFPYGCVEQTMSRFMPTVLVADAMKRAKLPPPAQADKIPQMVAEGYTRLKNMRHGDGGWGWWEYDDSDPFLTSLVLEGIAKGERAGYRAPEGLANGGLDWAAKWLKDGKKKEWQKDEEFENERAYAVYVLALHRRPEARVHVEKLKTRTASSLSSAILARKALGINSGPQLQRLLGLAQKGEGVMSWPEDYWGVETTARALTALVATQPESPDVKSVIRYLVMNRRGDMWWSTRDTSYAIGALTEYLGRFPEKAATGEVVVRVNGTEVARVAATTPNGSPRPLIEVPLSQMKPGANQLELVATNGGTLFYSTDLRQVVPATALDAEVGTNGLQIERSYHVLSVQAMENGDRSLLPSKAAIESAQAGDLIQVQLKLKAERDVEFVLIEDPIPASCRITDRADLMTDEVWSNWWSKSDFRDDKAAFFARRIPKGEHTLTYVMRAEIPGEAKALPTLGYSMYAPDVRSSSRGGQLRVSP